MKKIDLGQTITILANIGVIAGIVFLGIQINQSNHLARAATRNDIAAMLVTSGQALVSDGDFLVVYFQAQENPESLTAQEYARVLMQTNVLWRMRENMHYQYRNGLFEDSEFAVEREAWIRDVSSALGHQFYCSNRNAYSKEFIGEIESLMTSTEC